MQLKEQIQFRIKENSQMKGVHPLIALVGLAAIQAELLLDIREQNDDALNQVYFPTGPLEGASIGLNGCLRCDCSSCREMQENLKNKEEETDATIPTASR
jgi:hypothetical protein